MQFSLMCTCDQTPFRDCLEAVFLVWRIPIIHLKLEKSLSDFCVSKILEDISVLRSKRYNNVWFASGADSWYWKSISASEIQLFLTINIIIPLMLKIESGILALIITMRVLFNFLLSTGIFWDQTTLKHITHPVEKKSPQDLRTW